MSLECTCCCLPFRSSFFTAPCGHALHPECVESLMAGERQLRCPECDAACCRQDLWQTFYSAGEEDDTTMVAFCGSPRIGHMLASLCGELNHDGATRRPRMRTMFTFHKEDFGNAAHVQSKRRDATQQTPVQRWRQLGIVFKLRHEVRLHRLLFLVAH